METTSDVGLCWWNTIADEEWSETATAFWSEGTAAVAVAVDMPESKRGWDKALGNLEAFFVGALQKRAVEVS